MSEIKVKRIDRFDAEFSVPGDKSLSHRAAIIGGIANGTSLIKNFLPSEDCLNTLAAMESLGVKVTRLEEMVGYGPVTLRIEGTRCSLREPVQSIDCGNSGTGMRLLAGLLTGQPFTSELFGDESLSGRPMTRITRPLAEMGAKIEALGKIPGCAPLRITGGEVKSITYDMPMASAQVKSAILLAGMFAKDKTVVNQPATTRDHTERLLRAFDVRVDSNGNEISIFGGQVPRARDFLIPGDISSAAFWIVAAAAIPGSRLLIQDVGLNPTRSAILSVLVRMGARISDSVLDDDGGEPIGSIEVRGENLRGTTIRKEEVPNLIDEVPILAVAAALAEGKTSIRNASELRVKETDRIATVADNLRAMGADVEEFDDGLEITGGKPLKGAELKSYGDHRIAMAFAIAGLFASGETVIKDADCINTSYPGFADQLEKIRRGKRTPDELNPEVKELLEDEA